MGKYVFFQMWEPFRQNIIANHLFYVEQAKKRLLSQFENIKVEAEEAEAAWLKKAGMHFDPDRHDPASFLESAFDHSVEFQALLLEMRCATRLSVVAGMYHTMDKQIRCWLEQEVRHWHFGEFMRKQIWKTEFKNIADLLECIGWNLRLSTAFKKITAYRLIVNVYKHGEGPAFDELKEYFPEYLKGLYGNEAQIDEPLGWLEYTDLAVSDIQIEEISQAIVEFWNMAPANVTEDQITEPLPGWFTKAIEKDRAVDSSVPIASSK